MKSNNTSIYQACLYQLKKYAVCIGLFVFFLDQWSKIWIITNFQMYEIQPIFGNWIRFKFIENSGLAFGIGSDFFFAGISKEWFFIFLTSLGILIVIHLYGKLTHKTIFMKICFGLIFGGACGNLCDKLFGYILYHGIYKIPYGRVVDFIDVGIYQYRWPTFNIADISISTSMILLLVYSWNTKHLFK